MAMKEKTIIHLICVLCLMQFEELKAEELKSGTKRAFLVACGDQHEDKSLNLPKAVEDVEKFRQSLLRTGFKAEDIMFMEGKAGVDLKYQPLRDAIMKQLELMVKGLNEGDTLVVALNGHGIHPKGAKTSYFVPLNGEIDKEKTLIPMDGNNSIYGMLKEAQKKKARVLLIVGACRNEIKGNVQALNQMDLGDPDVPPEGVAAIYSCGVGQKTYFDEKGGSYFYEHLSKAWLGEYHLEEEKITLEMVFKEVREKTSRDVRLLHSKDQKPEIRREYKGEWSIFQNDVSIRQDYDLVASEYRKGLDNNFRNILKEQASRKINAWKNSSNSGSPEGMWLYGECLKKGVMVKIDTGLALKNFKKSAEQGLVVSMTEVGRCYLDGNGVEVNAEEGIRWLRKAADKNCSQAMVQLSICYRDGLSVDKDEKVAFSWCQKSSELGNVWAIAELGWYYDTGVVVNEDQREAFKLFTKAANAGESYAMFKIGEYYLEGIVVQKDENKGFKLIFDMVKKVQIPNFNERYFIKILGDCYLYGKGVEKNEKEAFYWYEKAALLGNISAINSLAHCYLNGTGCNKDEKKALDHFEKAADLGSASALNMLGYRFYSKGLVVEQNLTKAFDYYEKAANLGDRYAMINLCQSYRDGKGVVRDDRKAFNWCKKAADLGFSIGLNDLGYYFYRTGLVVPKDGHKAFELYTKAAAIGCTAAMVNLGASYEDGFGAPRDLKQAIYWYRQAASKGRVEGKNALRRLGYDE